MPFIRRATMKGQITLPLPFPDPAQDFVYSQIQDPHQQRHVIWETVAKRMELIWKHVAHCVYSEIPGFSKESRSSGVYWYQYRNPPPPRVYVFAEFTPTRKFQSLIGMPIPKPRQFRVEGGLSLRLALLPPNPHLGHPTSVDIRLFSERALPVKSLLAAWDQSRDVLARLIETANAKVCFGDLLEEHPEPYALDHYHLATSRKHRVDFVCELTQITEVSSITIPVLALARIYHAIQGFVRGDPTRLSR
ncbi:MAG: hypothetical protein ACREBW_09635 [Candidatus Micrarchaeaceae archaeon]